MVAKYDYEQSVKLTTDALQAQKAEEQAKAQAAKAAAEAQRLALENLANQISEINKTLTTGSELNVIVDTKEVDNLKAKIDEAVKPRQLMVTTSKQGNKEYTDAETQKFMEIGRSFRNKTGSELNVIVDTKEVDNLKAKIDEAVKPRQLIVATSKQGNKEYTDAETQKFMEIGRSFRNNDFSNLPMPNIAGVSRSEERRVGKE